MALIPGRKFLKKIACSRLTEFLLFWTMPAMGSQKAAEDSQNKEDINESHGLSFSFPALVTIHS